MAIDSEDSDSDFEHTVLTEESIVNSRPYLFPQKKKKKKKKGQVRDVVYDIDALESLPSGSTIHFDGNFTRDPDQYQTVIEEFKLKDNGNKKILDTWERTKFSEDLKDKSPSYKGTIIAEEHKDAILKVMQDMPVQHRDIQYFKVWEHDFKIEEEKVESMWEAFFKRRESSKPKDTTSIAQKEKVKKQEVKKKKGKGDAAVKAKMTKPEVKEGELEKGKKRTKSPEAKSNGKKKSETQDKEEKKPESQDTSKIEMKTEAPATEGEIKEKATEGEKKPKTLKKPKKKRQGSPRKKEKKEEDMTEAELVDKYGGILSSEYVDKDALMRLGLELKEEEMKMYSERMEKKKAPKSKRQINRELKKEKILKEQEELEKKEVEMIETAERDHIRNEEQEFLAYRAQNDRNLWDESVEDKHIILVTDDEIKNFTVKAPNIVKNSVDDIEIIDDPKYLKNVMPELLEEPKPSRLGVLAKPIVAVYNPCAKITRRLTKPVRRLLRPVAKLAMRPFFRDEPTDTDDEEIDEWLEDSDEMEPGSLETPFKKIGKKKMPLINEQARIKPKVTEVSDMEKERIVKDIVPMSEVTFHNKQQIDYVLEITKKNVWYYRDRLSVPRGPCTMPVLREAWVNGVIDGNTLIWGHGFMEWLPIKNIRTLVMQIRIPEGSYL